MTILEASTEMLARSTTTTTVGWIGYIIIGALAGWIAGKIVKGQGSGILLNIVVGIVGALIAGWLISPLVGVATINQGISIGSILVSLVGAVILLAIVNLFRRRRVR